MILAAYNPNLFDRTYWASLEGRLGLFMRDSWRIIGRVLTCSRIAYKPDCLSFFVNDPISDIDTRNAMSFADCADRRAMDLLEQWRAVGLPYLNVLWSGGIDSTVALVSLMKNWRREDLECVRIVLSENSIEEYPWFYHHYIANHFPIIDTFENRFDSFFENALVLTGEFGDQTFGSDLVELVAREVGWDAIKRDSYRDTVRAYFIKRAGEKGGARFFSLYQPIVKESPIPICNAFDFLWWWNFSQKWQSVGYRSLLYSSPENVARNARRIYHFFGSHAFQAYSLTHHHEKMTGGWDTYKMPAKRYIADYTGDLDYLKKLKVRSLQNLNPFHKCRRILTSAVEFAEQYTDFAREDFEYAV